jgi:hypothetical protein
MKELLITDGIQMQFYSANRARFVVKSGGAIDASMHVSLSGTQLTVYSTISGKGELRCRLFCAMMRYARANNLQVVALCPFVHFLLASNARLYADLWSRTGVRD